MQKHKKKLVAAILICALLTGAWFLGQPTILGERAPDPTMLAQIPKEIMPQTLDEADAALLETAEYLGYLNMPETGEEIDLPSDEPTGGAAPTSVPSPSPQGEVSPVPTPSEPPQAEASPLPTPPTSVPESETASPGTFTVTLSVRVDTLLNNMDLLSSDRHELVPASGVIFAAAEVTVTEGESVFDVLQREMRSAGIHMSARFTPGLNSAYVESINNLFEFDAGPLSGWMYSVNGGFPGTGASQRILSPGDVIVWVYTLDLGRDVGGGVA